MCTGNSSLSLLIQAFSLVDSKGIVLTTARGGGWLFRRYWTEYTKGSGHTVPTWATRPAMWLLVVNVEATLARLVCRVAY